ncbi:hypothetical protein GCM10008957_33350 [Deinococcus ruber]|uniref:Uncharacterized protein n=1 Tax=Deinococcus ruber TaxID=1848197 RepID=A0A918CF08_9DEIO|nr:hypothetical protein GCM10008957_33350 [Deinococcus ruber]
MALGIYIEEVDIRVLCHAGVELQVVPCCEAGNWLRTGGSVRAYIDLERRGNRIHDNALSIDLGLDGRPEGDQG